MQPAPMVPSNLHSADGISFHWRRINSPSPCIDPTTPPTQLLPSPSRRVAVSQERPGVGGRCPRGHVEVLTPPRPVVFTGTALREVVGVGKQVSCSWAGALRVICGGDGYGRRKGDAGRSREALRETGDSSQAMGLFWSLMPGGGVGVLVRWFGRPEEWG